MLNPHIKHTYIHMYVAKVIIGDCPNLKVWLIWQIFLNLPQRNFTKHVTAI